MNLPRVHLTEESMREGMQIESASISLDDKLRLLDGLSETGLEHIVVGSFVSPRYTPQMADIDALLERFTPRPGVRYSALALNAKGRERAARWMPPLEPSGEPPYTLVHLCDTFTRRNANVSQAEEIDAWPATIADAVESGATRAGLGVNAVFGSNFEGRFGLDRTFEMLERQARLWEPTGLPIDTVWLGDPMGWCMPDRVEKLLTGVRSRFPEVTHFYLHLHDARGLALASTYAAVRSLERGTDLYLDCTAGGIGGCPYCGSGRATGLAPTEDLVHMLDQLGVGTGVDLGRLIAVVWDLEEVLGRQTAGHVSKAGPLPESGELFEANLPVVESFEEARHFALGESALDPAKRPWKQPIPDRRTPA